ncbi:cytochrome P450 [Streptomyces sp. MMG1121]|uniref:cytochrome P450 n=1 Tax=Streptomyces sp. MMG1121 TaxID=1415544 RepID=UPI000AF92626|nr:cytochrome P450 [Streptomyces sp. MMG1121]
MSSTEVIPSAPGSLPLVGHALALARDPLRFVLALAAVGPLVRFRLGTLPVVMVCEPDLTRQVLLDAHTFDRGGPLIDLGREIFGNGLLTCPASAHHRQRRLCQPSFHPRRLADYAPVFSAAAQRLTHSWHDGQVIDANSEMRQLTTQTAVETLLGSTAPPSETRAVLVGDLETISTGALRRMLCPRPLNALPIPFNRRFGLAHQRLRHALASTAASRRADGKRSNDLLDSLLTAVDTDTPGAGSVLDEHEVVDQALTFFAAGIESTANTLAWALVSTAASPDVATRLGTEADTLLGERAPTMALVPALTTAARVVAETLRLHPPLTMANRVVMHATELGGHHFAPGTTIAWSPYLIHHHPGLYPHPDRFDPDRWQDTTPDRRTYLPFGAGPHRCIGDHFALTQATLTVASIAAHWTLTPVTDQVPRPTAGLVPRPHPARLRVTARR